MFDISKLMAKAADADEKTSAFADISNTLDKAPRFKKALETMVDSGWNFRTFGTEKGGLLDIYLEKGNGPDMLRFSVFTNRRETIYYTRSDEVGMYGGPNAPGAASVDHPIASLEDAVEPLMDYTFKNMPKFTELLLEEQRQELRSPIIKGLDRLQAALK